MIEGIDPDIISALPHLHNLPDEEKREILDIIEKLEEIQKYKKARLNFMDFVHAVWPGFIEGSHHRLMGEAFEEVVNGDQKRLIINMAPRHTKSEFASYLLPAWYLGNNPGKKVIQTAHTAELAVGFGRKVRNLFDTDEFKSIFPGVSLRSDSKAAGRWATSHGGEYFAIGVGGAVTGKGADLLIIDDPHSEQEAQLGDPNIFDRVFSFYTHIGEQSITDARHDNLLTSQTILADAFLPQNTDGSWSFNLQETESSNSIVNDMNVQIYVECITLQPKG